MDYSITKYAYFFISSKGIPLAYCSKNNSFLSLTKELYNLLLSCKRNANQISQIDQQSLSILLKNGIIVNKSDDDAYLLRHHYETDKKAYSGTNLLLTIVPTLDCNFSCAYCFENNKRNVYMSETTISMLIEFIKRHNFIKSLSICWYGGEPLLAFNIMKKIMIKLQNEIKLPILSHVIVTNGYHLNREVIDFCEAYKVTCMQVTLDGIKERHDSIRINKSNQKASFDKIIDNMDMLLKKIDDFKLHIRVNIEKKNLIDFHNISNYLNQKWPNKKTYIYPGFLRIDDKEKKCLSCDSMQRKDIAEFITNLAMNKNSKFSYFPKRIKNMCMAIRKNAYIIGPEGEIYKCWNDVGDTQKVIGDIYTNKITNSYLYHKYMVASKWYNRKACINCFFLPICGNGCAWYVLKNMYENYSYDICNCIQKSPGILNKCLEYYYDQIKNET